MSAEATPSTANVDVTVGIPTYNRSRLLEKSIASVLRQSHHRFTLVVSDNASEDDTASVVTSFNDPRIVYRRLARNVGRAANSNRLIELAETEFMVLLGDDDRLHPDHLSLTLDALVRWPTVGVAHTGCVIVDINGDTLVPHHRFVETPEPIAFESGVEYLERSMKSGWAVCFPSATFRRDALVGGGELRPQDGMMDDVSLLMRIATGWDFAYLNRPLATITVHPDASSSSLGTFTPDGYRASRFGPDMVRERRLEFLTETELPDPEARRLARIADRAYRREVLSYLSMRADTGDSRADIFKALGKEILQNRRLGLDPRTGRFVVGHLGGRALRERVRRIRLATSHSN